MVQFPKQAKHIPFLISKIRNLNSAKTKTGGVCSLSLPVSVLADLKILILLSFFFNLLRLLRIYLGMQCFFSDYLGITWMT